MANRADKYADNIEGAFYVDDQCIDCDACRDCAPDFCRRNDERGSSYDYRQPADESERAKCVDAMDGCPVEAIGSDGAD